MTIISVDVGHVDVDVAVDDFDTDELILELESRGYVVYDDEDEGLSEMFDDDELDHLRRILDASGPMPGSLAYNIREKLVKR